MKCKLCDLDKKLVKAHIIPDFLYEGMFNEHHRITLTTFPELSEKSKIPTGIYDKNILCADCDNITIGKLETYAKSVLKSGRDQIHTINSISPNTSEIKIQNVDYTKFKLFLISIYFKASITSQKFFSEVKLDTLSENRLREMLIEGNPGNENEFPALILDLRLKHQVLTKTIMEPGKVTFEGKDGGHIFLINGLFYWFCKNSSEFKNPTFQKSIIKKSNEMSIPVIGGSLGLSLYNKFTGLEIK